MSARVFLGKALVGELRPNTGGPDTVFEFDAVYASSASRPVLGRWFEDQRIEPPRTFPGAPLPKYFRNLLPEGALRKIVETRLGHSERPEYSMLLRLGGDLPGAVRVTSDALDLGPLEEIEQRGRQASDPFRFALTGVQPKLTLIEGDDRLTVPLEGQDGYWIAKLGSPAFRGLVHNEHLMLEWAHACGLDVPEHRVIHASEIVNFPTDFDPNQEVLIVRRFDRGVAGARIHQEDFAQVFDIAPEERCAAQSADLGWAHYGSIGAVVNAVCGEDDHLEYMRRLVFMVLSGNGDAHLKNWALTYPDGLKARLAPVYDVVSTIVYPRLNAHPSLRWSEPIAPTLEPPKRLAETTLDDLIEVASHADGATTPQLVDALTEFVRTVRAAWPSVAASATPVVRDRVTAHLHAAALK